MIPTPAPAATVLLLRPQAGGFEVFLLQRHMRSGFMPRMWVFPGGRLDPDDASTDVRGGGRAAEAFGLDAATGRALMVCAARETFEEAGIWLGTGDLPEEERLPLQRGERRLAEVMAEHAAALDLDAFQPWARWVTPEAERRRYDALFLTARADRAEGRHDEHETVDSAWMRPADALAAGHEAVPLAPPTWCVLTQLTRFDTVEDVLAATATCDLRPVQPVPTMEASGLVMLLPGSAGHPEDEPRDGLPSRLVMTPEGWRAEDAHGRPI